MRTIRVSMTAFRRRLGKLVNQAAFEGHRIVLVSRGETRAAIIGVEDLERLEERNERRPGLRARYRTALAAADRIRERIRRWQKRHGIKPQDSVEILRMLRANRDREIAGPS